MMMMHINKINFFYDIVYDRRFFYFIGKFDLPLTKPFLFFQDAAMILEEQPSKVSEAVKLFLQGLGYTTVRSLHTSRIRTAVSLAGTPVKKPPSSTTSTNR